MENGKRLYFDDAISYIDKSKFVDYPVVKIRSFDRSDDRPLKKILLYVYGVIITSGVAYLLM